MCNINDVAGEGNQQELCDLPRLLAHVFVLLLAEEYPNIANQVVVVEIPGYW